MLGGFIVFAMNNNDFTMDISFDTYLAFSILMAVGGLFGYIFLSSSPALVRRSDRSPVPYFPSKVPACVYTYKGTGLAYMLVPILRTLPLFNPRV